MQLEILHGEIDRLQRIFGDPSLCPVYGTGCVQNPKVMLVFMNPTGRNISTTPKWSGIRASWLGTKNVWRLLFKLGWITNEYLNKTQEFSPQEWTQDFAQEIYSELAKNKIFLTNLAKCTQIDARPLKDSIFKNYLNLIYQEITLINPQHIITFGNQVSSILLDTPISVSNYQNQEYVDLIIGDKKFKVFPTHYPVGRGQMNMPKAIKRIKRVLS